MGEMTKAILINLISSAIYSGGSLAVERLEAIGERKNRQFREELERQLDLEIESFCRRHEDSLFLDSDWFHRYLEYQRSIQRVCRFVLDMEEERVGQDEFVNSLMIDVKRYAEQSDGSRNRLLDRDWSVLREFYATLIKAVREAGYKELSIGEQFLGKSIITAVETTVSDAIKKEKQERQQGLEADAATAEPVYRFPVPYIPRKCHVEGAKALNQEAEESLISIWRNHRCMVLLGDAGGGKTTELQRIATEFSREDTLPPVILLTLREYTDETFEELIAAAGGVPYNSERLYIIDGFDEITGECKKLFLKQLSKFRRAEPKASFLISSRSNFYRDGLLGEGFTAVWLNPLSESDVRAFVEEKGIVWADFIREVSEKKMEEFLWIPFYLLELCEMYRAEGGLPQRPDLMKRLIERKFSQDLDKFRMTGTVELDESKARLFTVLRKLAVSMNCMDCVVLEEETYQRLIGDLESRELLKHSGIWKKNGGVWHFVHNNFREYLAAEYLAEQPLKTVQDFVTAGHPEWGIRANWHHVLSYLIPMGEKELTQWVLEKDFTIFLQLERDRLPLEQRTEITIAEMERLKAAGQWLGHDNYRVAELTAFGQSYHLITYLLDEIRNFQHVVSQGNGLYMMGQLTCLYGREDEVKEVLTGVCLDKEAREHEICYAVRALTNLGLVGEELLDRLMEHFAGTRSSYIRYGLYDCIKRNGYVDTYVDFLLDGIGLVGGGLDENRLGNEIFELQDALKQITEPEALEKLFCCLAEREHAYSMLSVEEIVKPAVICAATLYQSAEDPLWKSLRDLCRCEVDRGGQKTLEYIFWYFQKTDTVLVLLEQELARMGSGGRDWWTPRSILALDQGKAFWEAYQKGEVSDDHVKRCLDILSVQSAYYRPLARLYQERTGIEIPVYEQKDYDTLRRKGERRYLEALTDQNAYLGLVNELAKLGGQPDYDEDEVDEIPDQVLEDRTDLEEVKRDFVRGHRGRSLRQWMGSLEACDWEDYASARLMQWMVTHSRGRDELPEAVKRWCTDYYYIHLDQVDIRQAVVWVNDSDYRCADLRVKRILYFAEQFCLPIPKEKAKDLLFCPGYWFSSLEGLISRCLTGEEIREQVIRNLREENLMGDVLAWHINYCISNGIDACAAVIIEVAKDRRRKDLVREPAVRYACGVMGATEVCRELLPTLCGRLFFQAVELVKDSRGSGLEDIIWNYGEMFPDEKLQCDACLIWRQDRRGLEHLRRYLEETCVIPDIMNPDPIQAVGGIDRVELLDELERLLELSVRKTLQDRSYDGVKSQVITAMTAIACTGKQPYEAVIRSLERFQERHEGDFGLCSFAERCKGDVRWRYQQNVQVKWSVGEVEQKVFSIL